jgi:hypothetical protein
LQFKNPIIPKNYHLQWGFKKQGKTLYHITKKSPMIYIGDFIIFQFFVVINCAKKAVQLFIYQYNIYIIPIHKYLISGTLVQ